MATLTKKQPQTIIYPDSDGNRMADNTEQFKWIVLIKEGLEALFSKNPDVFVAGDLLWYPEEGKPHIRKAPDVLVVFGRPKGYRGSYKQWEEDNIPPQVVFEINSPSNSHAEMLQKLVFYQNYGVQEYYFYDPDKNQFLAWVREGEHFKEIENPHEWQSPLLGIRFLLDENTLHIYKPTGERFASYTEMTEKLEETREILEETKEKLEKLAKEKEQLTQKLRELGYNPDEIIGDT